MVVVAVADDDGIRPRQRDAPHHGVVTQRQSLAGASTDLTVTTTATTAAKSYKITVEIEGGQQTRVVTLALKVNAPV